jgi:hypothetical protein
VLDHKWGVCVCVWGVTIKSRSSLILRNTVQYYLSRARVPVENVLLLLGDLSERPDRDERTAEF